jgi:hypothetical protein
MAGETLLFLFSVIVAAVLLFGMVFFVSFFMCVMFHFVVALGAS